MNDGGSGVKDSILVTGASRGIGMHAALHLAERGFRVWASMRDLDASGPLLEEAGRRRVKVETVRLDVTDRSSIAASLRVILDRSGVQSR